MSKKFIFVLVGIIFFFGFKLASAELIISEVMYNPVQSDSYNEWIEIYNNGGEIDLTNLLVCDKSVMAGYIKHGDGSLNQDSGLTLGAGKFAIITDGNTTSGGISGTDVYNNYSVNSSALALHVSTSEICGGLTNSGKEIGINSSTFDYTTYVDKANGDGNSLQLIDGEWKGASPTPGEANPSSSGSDNNSGNDNTNNDGGNTDNTNDNNTDNTEDITTDTNTDVDSSSNSEAGETKTVIKNPNIKAKILTKTLAFIGQPLEFKSAILGYSNENVVLGKIFWNFGDGSSFEQINNFAKFNHIYFYPGEYPVSMEYYSSYLSDTPDAVNKIIIKVVPMTVSISKVGDAKDFFVELTNNSNYEVDISKWILNANGKIFVFPKNSVIMSKKAVTISGKITGFVLGDEKNLKLISGTGEIVFDYNSSFSQNEIVVEPVKTFVKNYVPQNESENIAEDKMPDTTIDQTQISGTDLSSTALLSDTEIKGTNNYLFFGIFGVLLALVGVGVYFIRRKGRVSNIKEGDDFKILDE